MSTLPPEELLIGPSGQQNGGIKKQISQVISKAKQLQKAYLFQLLPY